MKSLDDLGIVSNGNDNSLSLGSGTKLDDALSTNLASIQAMFSNESTGLAVSLGSYLDKTVGDEGTLESHKNALTKQSTAIDVNISAMERLVQANKQRLTDSFITMETAQARINQQLQYLNKFTASNGK